MKNKIICMLAIIILICCDANVVYGSVNEGDYSYMLDEIFEDNNVNGALEEIFGERRVGIKQLIEQLISGEKTVAEAFLDFAEFKLSGFSVYKTLFTKLMLLVVFCALFGFLPQVFGNEQTVQMGHYISFIVLAAYLLFIITDALSVVQDSIEMIIFLMNAIIPVYLMAIAISGAISTATLSAGVFEILMYLVQYFILKLLCPAVMIFTVLGFTNQLLESDKFSRLVELIKKLISWILKGLLTMLVGYQFLQNLITPYVDKFNSSITKQGLEAIPAVGDVASSGISIAVGAALIVKNTVGVVAMILLLAIVTSPIIELLLYCLVLMLINAFLQPVLQSGTLKILDVSVGAVKLLFKILLTVILLFLISIALLAATSGGV